MAKQRIPRILDDWLIDTGQYGLAREHGQQRLSDAHLLEEAEHIMEDQGWNPDSFGGYHPSSWAALRRFIGGLRERGVEPDHDFVF